MTVPPNLALWSSGFGVPKERWDEVKKYRLGKKERKEGEPSMRELLGGKWRDVPEEERWWEDAMKPFEEERMKRLGSVLKLREGIDGVKVM